MRQAHGIALKKKFGQHFLRDRGVVQRMCTQVMLTDQTSIFEIGCGDGFLTQEILAHSLQRLWVFEIDEEWANYVRTTLKDARLMVFQEDFLRVDFSRFEPFKPWTVLANLPYQITFQILHRFQEMRHMLAEGVIMMQEEVAHKILLKSGRGYGYPSLFFQYYFEWRQLEKISPHVFNPPPKVFSRLLHFKPRHNVLPIPHEKEFWHFIRVAFRQPRRTLKNNLLSTQVPLDIIPAQTLMLRAQQMSMQDLLALWNIIHPHLPQLNHSQQQ